MSAITKINLDEFSWDIISDIKLLHKENESEVFLRKCKSLNENHFLCSAFLKNQHPYYSDHSIQSSDLIYLLECGRQAETYLVHQHYNQPLNINFILEEWSFSFENEFQPNRSLEGKEILIEVITKNQRWAKERLLYQEYDIYFFINQLQVAKLNLRVKYMKRDAYLAIRERTRKSRLIYSNQLKFQESDRVVPKNSKFGRENKSNLTLTDLNKHEDNITARLLIDFHNKSYFDHKQDHYPAMVLVEAGKQISHYVSSLVHQDSQFVLTSINCHFKLYAEFDQDVKVIAKLLHEDQIQQNTHVMVNFIQNEKTIACAELKLSNLKD
ncbi:hypothetical protein KDD30_11605 [Photobacterium sp. GJ3]|uniref:AfsA-related hotdog domain-containing protein n=1 Tax=Photobacterium sp. GJ3 TaxID=2829502 RepID=UPI001B8C87C1|nr:AfsA-related hotdog domain-containing protein [Photobacterium sp. GJ3]QUJ66788.1 hypothetical protein KDD30_11605 [Photobacterium sp. GJ3]